MLVLIVFGFLFYRIAEQYSKNKWLWALVGAGSYVAIQFLFGILFGILLEFGMIDEPSGWIITLFLIAISGGATYFLYNYLKKKWEAEDNTFSRGSIDEIGQNKEN